MKLNESYMELDETQFTFLLENIPSIEVPLEWDGFEGRAEIEDHEMIIGIYLLFADFSVLQTGRLDKGDALTPPDFILNDLSSEIDAVYCYIQDDGNSIEFTPEQKKLLFKTIHSKIQTV